MAKLAPHTGAENVESLYESLLQLTMDQTMTIGHSDHAHLAMVQTMTIGHSDHARYVAANYMAQTQECCGTSGLE